MGGPENGNFPLLYVIKMSLHRGWVVLKSLKTPLRKIKMAPYLGSPNRLLVKKNSIQFCNYISLFHFQVCEKKLWMDNQAKGIFYMTLDIDWGNPFIKSLREICWCVTICQKLFTSSTLNKFFLPVGRRGSPLLVNILLKHFSW